jgi:DeoR family transcriptional regulator of aga operon
LFDPSLQEKQKQHSQEKQRIAGAAKMVEEGKCLLLDSGTTTTAVAHELRRFSQLTVITNAVNIAAELASTNFEVILVGGRSAEAFAISKIDASANAIFSCRRV